MRIGIGMLVGAVVAAGLAGCGAEGHHADPPPRAARTAPTPAAPAPRLVKPTHAPPPARTLPEAPSLRRPAVLAAQLRQAEQTIRRPDSAEGDVRRAAWFEQLATRALGRAPERTSQRVLARLGGTAAHTIRADIAASRELTALTEPQPKLPPWRVVEPAPPRALLGYYRRAEKMTGVPWEYLAAVNLVETRMGRIRGDSTAGAQGPMQFLPSTFEAYGAGGDIHKAKDAILAAARLLRANGAPQDMAGALWHYNQSEHYVRAVTEYASAMRHSPAAYTGYWHWQVLYRQRAGTFLLPEGYPKVAARRVPLS